MHELISKRLFAEQAAHISDCAARRGWVVYEIDYPMIDLAFTGEGRNGLRLRFKCDDYNDLPPSIELLNLDGTAVNPLPRGPTSIFNSPHSTTGAAFVCMIGSREYHTHESHVSDHWCNYKNLDRNTLPGLVFQLWRAWKKASP